MTTPITYPNKAAALRAKLLGQQTPPARKLEIDGETFFVRHPMLSDRQKMLDLAGVKPKAPTKGKKDEETIDVDVPLDAMMAAACVLLAVDESGAALFTPVDMETIRAASIGGWLERLARACLEALNGRSEGEG